MIILTHNDFDGISAGIIGKVVYPNAKVEYCNYDNIKIIYTNEGECEIRRKENNNPVICRNKNQEIYRLHGEWKYLKDEMYKLAGINEKIEK